MSKKFETKNSDLTSADWFEISSSLSVVYAATRYLSEILDVEVFPRNACQELASHLASNLAAIVQKVDSLADREIPF